MNNELKAKNYISRYIATTYIVFWIGILLVGSIFLLVNNDLITDIGTIPLSWVPTIVLLIMFGKLLPGKKRKEWIKESFSSKINIVIVLITFVLFVFSVVLTYVIMFYVSDDVPGINSNLSSFGSVIVAIILSIITGATGEELGWRGFLQRYYEEKNGGNVLKGAFKVGLIWSLWHIPLWFTSASGDTVWFLLNHIVTFFVQCMCLSVIIAICYKRCRNMFIPMWIHFLSNVTMSLISPYFTTSTVIMGGKGLLTVFYVLIAVGFVLWHKKTENKE
jgi:membrane protease YdiL (CAAX protease family)